MMDVNPGQTRPVEGHKTARWAAAVALAAVMCIVLVVGVLAVPADAAEAPVGLGTAASYSVLGGQTVTNTGHSKLSGDLGVSPGTAITGFPPGTVGGAKHAGDAQAAKAQSDLTIAYNDAAGRAKTASVAGDLVGKTLTAGVYKSTGPLALSGTVTLNGQGNPNAVFIFQIASTLITASASHVSLLNGAQACHVFWQVGSSATLGTTSSFKGTIMALTSIAVQTGALVQGRALARNGAVTLDNDTFTAANCGTTPTATSSAPRSSSSAPAASSSPFVPGPGLTGDNRPGGGFPLKKILFGVVVVAVLGAAVAMTVPPLRRRGNHS
ncbi:MAG: ice-binding family protein [Mycobacteriaceae bacterium]